VQRDGAAGACRSAVTYSYCGMIVDVDWLRIPNFRDIFLLRLWYYHLPAHTIGRASRSDLFERYRCITGSVHSETAHRSGERRT
jgi:hypothetical protein